MNIKRIHSSSPPPRKTKSAALNNAVNQAGSWTPSSCRPAYQKQNFWIWPENKSANSTLHKPARSRWLFVLGQRLREVCSEQRGKTIPDLPLQQVLFAPLKGIAQSVMCVPNTACPTEISIFIVFLMYLTASLQFLWALGNATEKPLY